MSNAINQVTPGLVNVQLDPAGAAAASRPGSSGAEPSATSPVDRTTLSPLGQLLDSAIRNANALSSFRADRVANLRDAIAGGTYQPDPGQVAQRVTQALKNSPSSTLSAGHGSNS